MWEGAFATLTPMTLCTGGGACVEPDGFTPMPGPGCSVTGGDYGPPTTQPTQSQQCPAYIYNFLTTMIPYANQLASSWSTNANFILALSAYESGWLGAHSQALQNPYGLTNAGGNDLSFNSYQQATNYWSGNDDSYIQNTTSINTEYNKHQQLCDGAPTALQHQESDMDLHSRQRL